MSASDPDVSGALLERELMDGGDLCDILSRLSSWELIVHTLDDCRDQSGGGRRQRWYLQSVDGTQTPRLLRFRKRLKKQGLYPARAQWQNIACSPGSPPTKKRPKVKSIQQDLGAVKEGLR